MLHIRTLATPAIILVMASVTLSAQSLMVGDEEGARVTAQIGHGGNGLDVAAALDSPAICHLIRFRADVGHGAWDGINSRGGEPPVTRATGSALFFFGLRASRRSVGMWASGSEPIGHTAAACIHSSVRG